MRTATSSSTSNPPTTPSTRSWQTRPSSHQTSHRQVAAARKRARAFGARWARRRDRARAGRMNSPQKSGSRSRASFSNSRSKSRTSSRSRNRTYRLRRPRSRTSLPMFRLLRRLRSTTRPSRNRSSSLFRQLRILSGLTRSLLNLSLKSRPVPQRLIRRSMTLARSKPCRKPRFLGDYLASSHFLSLGVTRLRIWRNGQRRRNAANS